LRRDIPATTERRNSVVYRPGYLFQGRYEVQTTLGQGGMSDTYRARDVQTGRTVVLKIPHANVLGNVFTMRHLRREISIGQMLDHPNIQRLITGGQFDEDERPYMVLEYVEGQNLRHFLDEQGPLPIEDTLHIIGQLLVALRYCHAQGIIHRDLKPENVLITPEGQIKLMDFGISLLVGVRRTTFTRLSNPIGTPDYAAPEQVSGQTTDERSDIYAAGILLYEMLSKRTPFEGDSVLAVVAQKAMHDPPRLRQICPDIPEALDAVVYRATRLDPDLRYSSAEEMLRDLANLDHLAAPGAEALLPFWGRPGPLGIRYRSWAVALFMVIAIIALAVASDILRQAGLV
jgi:eukaryotic-like serine/threonine-protein kinase